MEIDWDKIYKLISGSANEKEKLEVIQWAKTKKSRKKFLKDSFDFYTSEDEAAVSFANIQKAWQKVDPRVKLRKKYLKYAASIAASVAFIVFTIFAYQELYNSLETLPYIKPGESKAHLILANGKDIKLDSKPTKLLANLSIEKQIKDKKASLVINVKSRSSSESLEYNEIVVPRYAEYQINLDDGTKVWLNSETKLKFPLVFGSKERVVYVSGEAYFKVAYNANKPFIVNIDDNTKVKVLGTEFNIRTYEESSSQSTLISGSIEFIHNGIATILNPGENCFLEKSTGEVVVSQADLMRVVAWKNGEFVYRNETLENIITDLSRWYKVDVSFENEEVKKERFYLYFDRSFGFEEFIYKLHKTGKIKYRYENNKIVIS